MHSKVILYHTNEKSLIALKSHTLSHKLKVIHRTQKPLIQGCKLLFFAEMTNGRSWSHHVGRKNKTKICPSTVVIFQILVGHWPMTVVSLLSCLWLKIHLSHSKVTHSTLKSLIILLKTESWSLIALKSHSRFRYTEASVCHRTLVSRLLSVRLIFLEFFKKFNKPARLRS